MKTGKKYIKTYTAFIGFDEHKPKQSMWTDQKVRTQNGKFTSFGDNSRTTKHYILLHLHYPPRDKSDIFIFNIYYNFELLIE